MELTTFLDTRNLRHIRRCGLRPCVTPYDVAQHSHGVSMLALYIGKELRDNAVNVPFSLESLLTKAIVHDIPEVWTSDIPYTVKHKDTETSYFFKRLETQLTIEKCNKNKTQQEVTNTLEILNCKSGVEGEVLKVLDLMELALYCKEEQDVGNSTLEDILKNCIDYMVLCVMFEDMLKYSKLFRNLWYYVTSNISVEKRDKHE